MKKLIILICVCVMVYSCNPNENLNKEEENQIFETLVSLNNVFNPEESVITYFPFPNMNRWGLNDGSGTEIRDEDRISSINMAIKEIKNNNILTESFFNRIISSFESNDTVNMGILLTNHQYGDQMLRVIPTRRIIDNEYCTEGAWDGDEKYLNMSNDEFSSFLMSRIQVISNKTVKYYLPYAEGSITLCDQEEREYFNYNYYFIKNKDGKWLLDDIKIEEQ